MLTKGGSNFDQVIEPDIALTALNAANVRRVEPASGRQLLLRPPLGLPKLPNPIAQPPPVYIPHGGMHRTGQTMSPETISIFTIYERQLLDWVRIGGIKTDGDISRSRFD